MALLIWGAAAAAETAPDEKLQNEKLKAVEQKLEAGRHESAQLDKQAATLVAEQARLQDASVAAAKSAQDYEERLTELEGQLKTLDAEAAAKQKALAADQAREAGLLSALEKLSQNPPEAMLFGPASPIDQVRGAMLLGAAVPQLEAQAKELQATLVEVKRLQAEISAKRSEMTQKQAALDAEQTRIGLMLRQKAALEGQTREAQGQTQKTLATLGAQASDLKDLIQRLERERQERAEAERKRAEEARQKAEREAAAKAEARRREAEAATRDTMSGGVAGRDVGPGGVAGRDIGPATAAITVAPPESPKGRDPLAPRGGGRKLEPGHYAAPVAGQVIKRFGESDGYQEAKGLTIRTRGAAQVVAPFDGQVMFAGPFKGYGQILIIDHGGGYHSLLAGIDQIEATVGQRVVTGEPVGVMKSGDPGPSLYLELRRQGQPINPLPWLAARDGKVSG
ncbi:peptidase M23 [Aliidongia dinghuensis]|uniref:Peptidase M23 n=1 Tax=Aliidongia dinghuensis TaxID=1867774 RepID=A0A8J3E3T6_9PROT|nr:peptidoglycan DD-metalloendopeptidase family protein [Aliidongia dinghuensis]GGF18640.1 peptidase M23 [Aliidongia dinghuensis]